MLVYQYDGSLEGFYSCVFESVYQKETPEAIEPTGAAQCRLFPPKYIETDAAKADRVRKSIPAKISAEALDLCEVVFCSCLEEKELRLLQFLRRGYREGGRFLRAGFSDAQLEPLLAARRHLMGEAHLLKGFIRFADYDGHLAATITPKNYILPYITRHFITRYRNENFMIYDKTNHVALIYENRVPRMVAAEHIEFPAVTEEEAQYRELWKHFYRTVAIKGRENPRCRMTHMPKRYWENMVEVRDELLPQASAAEAEYYQQKQITNGNIC